MRSVEAPDDAVLEEGAEVVRRYLRPTPLLSVPELGPRTWVKVECFQPTGSFKVRGALAAVAATVRRAPGVHLVAASAGNHGLGVAYAAHRLGADATVVVPETASRAKLDALRRYDVTLVRHGATYDDAEGFALELADGGAGHYLSPYNDPDVIAGQASIARELAGQAPDATTIVLPVGGGGLASGVALATAGRGVRIVGVEPQASATMAAAVTGGRAGAEEETVADGLAGGIEPGSVTVDILATLQVEMVAVDEEAIRSAVRFLATGVGVVAEGAGAAATAAVRAGGLDLDDGPVVIVVTGRNIEPGLLASIVAA